MQDLVARAERIAALLKHRRETIATAEGAAAGLIAAALLGVPGASAYCLGGAIIYTRAARALLGVPETALAGLRPSTEAYALLLGRTARERFGASWVIAESGAAGPTGNRYGDAPGHSCIALVGPIERAITLETGQADRLQNMRAFAAAALDLCLRSLDEAPAA